MDADVEFDGDLIDRLFARAPEERTAVLAGAVADAVVEDTWVARWLREEGAMSQSRTLGGARPYAQTAHCAVRRAAFEAVGGFTEGIRSGGDADLCFRLADAGWALEERDAVVRHVARARLRPLLAQRARHGAGAAWLEQRYPGTFPETARPVGLAWWLARSLPAGRTALLPPLTALAFAAGRRRSNAVPRG